MTRLTTVIIEERGFIKGKDNLPWIDWIKNGFIVSSEENINGGGFHSGGIPINTPEDLERIYRTKTGEKL